MSDSQPPPPLDEAPRLTPALLPVPLRPPLQRAKYKHAGTHAQRMHESYASLPILWGKSCTLCVLVPSQLVLFRGLGWVDGRMIEDGTSLKQGCVYVGKKTHVKSRSPTKHKGNRKWNSTGTKHLRDRLPLPPLDTVLLLEALLPSEGVRPPLS